MWRKSRMKCSESADKPLPLMWKASNDFDFLMPLVTIVLICEISRFMQLRSRCCKKRLDLSSFCSLSLNRSIFCINWFFYSAWCTLLPERFRYLILHTSSEYRGSRIREMSYPERWLWDTSRYLRWGIIHRAWDNPAALCLPNIEHFDITRVVSLVSLLTVGKVEKN